MDQCGHTIKQQSGHKFLSVLVFILILLSAFLFFSERTWDVESYRYTLGQRLFFDKNISLNHTKSCGSCHAPELAFSDGYRRSVTPFGENVKHNAPSLLNVSQLHFFDWANLQASTLEKQMERPLFGKHPMELGLNAHMKEVETYLQTDNSYPLLLRKAFPVDSYSLQQKMILAIASYERKLVSLNSPYDDYRKGNRQALSTNQIQGMTLFFSEELGCFKCHGGLYFTNAALSKNPDSVYFNIGLYNEINSYPMNDLGLMECTGRDMDNGKFKVPSLRNVAVTAPYMHDGSVATLKEVIDIYARGGRIFQMQDGAKNTHKHPFIHGFQISKEDKNNLIEFLQSLTEKNK